MEKIDIRKIRILDIVLIVLAIITFIFIRVPFFNVINPFIYALVVAYLLDPFVKMLEKKKIKRIWAILIVFLIIFSVFAVLFATFLPMLIEEVESFIDNIPSIFESVKGAIENFQLNGFEFLPQEMRDFLDLDEQISNISDNTEAFFSGLVGFLVQSTGTIFDLLMTPLIAFYYLNDKDKIKDLIIKAFPLRYREFVQRVGIDVDKVLGGFVKGQLTVAAFVGILMGIGSLIIGIPYALIIGLVAGITNIIPFFGPWLGGILPMILAFIEKPIMALWALGLIVVVQQIEAALITPRVMSKSVGIHPLLIIFSVLFFGSLFGIVGMILGVPMMAVLLLVFGYINEYRNHMDKEKIEKANM
ncbi:MAG: AI-2E family transporter [Gudongella sp.]|nr:AI-2E family transporter [Gudongella sp.]